MYVITKIKKGLSLFILLSLLILSLTAKAHEITPSIVTLKQTDSQAYELTLDVNLEALLLEIGSAQDDTNDSPKAQAYNDLRALSTDNLQQQAEGFLTTLPERFNLLDKQGNPLKLSYQLRSSSTQPNSDPAVARESLVRYQVSSDTQIKSVSFSWPASLGDAVFRVATGDQVLAGLWVQAGDQSESVDLGAGIATNQSLQDYIIIGFEHILPLGMDHILFVIGLYLLSQKLSALLWQVSAFTLAHTFTLAAATLGWIAVSPAIVEPLIAASISFVAIENLFHHRLSRGRVVLIFCFGLLHGLGFAGILTEIGLNPDAFIPSLIAFNVGVELGQLAIIVGLFLLLGLWFGKTRHWESWIRTPLSILIATIGAYWFIERIFL